jgi:hypothetical protein
LFVIVASGFSPDITDEELQPLINANRREVENEKPKNGKSFPRQIASQKWDE